MTPRHGIVLALILSACSMGPPAAVRPGEPSELVVRMVNMEGFGMEWEFFDRRSDSLAAGMVRADNESWCARIPVPTGAETARLFNGLEDQVINPNREPFWTLRLASGHGFVPDSRAPC